MTSTLAASTPTQGLAATPAHKAPRARLLRPVLGLVVTLVVFFPVYWLLVTSLRTPADVQTSVSFFPSSLNLDGYRDVLGDPGILRNLANSLVYGLGSVVVSLTLGSLAAYGLARYKFRGRSVVMFFLLLLQAFPGIMIAIPLFLMFSRLGLVDNRIAMVLAIGTKSLPFAILMLRPFIASLSVDIEEAALIDGCTRLGCLRRIVLPLTMPGLVTVAAFNFLSGWGDLLFAITLLTDDSKRPIAMGLYKYMGNYGIDWNQLMAASVVAAIPAIAVFVFAQRYLVAGLTTGATKD